MMITEEKLQELYHCEGKTMQEIADELDSSAATIHRRMKKYGIDARDSENPENRLPNNDSSRNSPSLIMSNGYEYFVDNTGDSQIRVAHHQILALVNHSIDEVSSNHIHHQNQIKWDNRFENIDVLSPAEHAAHHLNLESVNQ